MLAWDTETCLIEEYVPAPELVCVSFDDGSLLDAREGAARMEELLNGNEVLIAHNAPFDLAVLGMRSRRLLPGITRAYMDSRIHCTKSRAQVRDCLDGALGDHKYSLKDLAKRHLHRMLKKDQWRLGYAALKDIPITDWPEGARIYAVTDAVIAKELHTAQGPELPEDKYHAYASWLMYIMHTPELRGAFLINNDTRGFPITQIDKIREEMMVRDLTTDLTPMMGKKFMSFVYRVSYNLVREAFTWL